MAQADAAVPSGAAPVAASAPAAIPAAAARQPEQPGGASGTRTGDEARVAEVKPASGPSSRRSAAAPTPAPAAPAPAAAKAAGAPARPTPPPGPPPATESTGKPGRGGMGLMGKLALALLALGGAAFFFTGNSPREPDPCQDALDQAAGLLAGGNAAAARSQTVLAMASCSGEARTKATDMQAAADKVLARQAACERSFRQIGNLVADRRQEKARTQLEALDTSCVDSPQGRSLQQKINDARATATDAASQVRRHLAEGDLKSAREQLERLAASNREHADLPGLRQEVQAAGAMKEPQREAVPEQTPAPPSRTAQPAPGAAPAVPAPQPVANAQSEMAQVLLRDAENALRQLRFDAAKTFVDSAQRLDPQNPQAAALARRIKERELQYLREETSIK